LRFLLRLELELLEVLDDIEDFLDLDLDFDLSFLRDLERRFSDFFFGLSFLLRR